MAPHPPAQPDSDDGAPEGVPSPFRILRAVVWGVGGGLALSGGATLARVFPPVELPLKLPDALPAQLGAWAVAGGAVAMLAVVIRAGRGAMALVGIAAAAAAACVFLVPHLGEWPALSLVGVVAGCVGYGVSRHVAAGLPPADYSLRALIPTPGLRAGLVALAFVVAAIVGRPSPVGWLVLAVGGFGLVLAAALIRQEGRIAELEERLRALERGRPREVGQPAPPRAELD